MIAEVGSIDGIGNGFFSVVNLLGVRLLTKIKEGGSCMEVVGELMLDSGAKEGLSDGTEA